MGIQFLQKSFNFFVKHTQVKSTNHNLTKKSNFISNIMPTYSEMILECLAKTANKKGTTKQAVVKFLQEHYSVEKTHYIKNALKKAVDSEQVVQLSGTGFNGRFKLPKADGKKDSKKESKKAKVSPKKAAVASKKPKKVAVKKNTVNKQKLAKKKK